jgi:antitoxin (DNA-binding transcriptional repressor) of toxin-antitoxin stability system
MRNVSVRDLRYDFKKVEQLLRQGEELRVTKRRKVIARLVPEVPKKTAMPDFLGRLRSQFGDLCLPVSGAEIVSQDRDE